MAISTDIYNTIIHGIKNGGLQGVSYKGYRTNDRFGDPNVTFEYIPLVPETESYMYSDGGLIPNTWYPATFRANIAELDEVVDGVKYISFYKPANSDDCYVEFADENGNVLWDDQLSSSWSCSEYWDTPLINRHNSAPTIMLAAGYNYAGVLNAGFALCNRISEDAMDAHSVFRAYNYQVTPTISGATEDFLTHLIGDDIWDATPGGEGGETGPDGDPSGGDGLFHRNDIDIPYSNLPTLSVTDTGFCSLYKMSAAQLQALANDLWDDNFFNSLAKHFSDPFQNIISLGIVPYEPVGSLDQVVIANYQCPTSGEKLSSNYFELNCGNINVREYYSHFADYETQIQLFLPYCGTVSINPSEVMNGSEGTIGVKYLFDIFSGACVAEVMCYSGGANHVLYQKEGNIRTELPITGANYAEYYKGLISSIGIMVGALAFGGVGISAATTTAGLAQSSLMAGAGVVGGMAHGLTQKPTYERSGNVSGTPGLLGIQYPYLIFTTPNYFGGKSIGEKCGYVSNLECHIGDERGFLQAEVDFEKLTTIDAPIEVLKKIKQSLAEGIYIEEVN